MDDILLLVFTQSFTLTIFFSILLLLLFHKSFYYLLQKKSTRLWTETPNDDTQMFFGSSGLLKVNQNKK